MFGQTSVTFELLFCLVITIVHIGLKEQGQGDNMLLKLACFTFIFTFMTRVGIFENAAQEGMEYTAAGLFFSELFSTICVIFCFGPIKVWMDIQRGETSLKDIKDGFGERPTWMARNPGDTVLPER